MVTDEPQPGWSPATRIAFRFCFVYFGLYSLTSQIAGGMLQVPGAALPALGVRWPMRDITVWAAARVFGVTALPVYAGNSGDTVFFWVQTAVLLAIAVLATGIWSDMDRARSNYVTLHKWFRLFIRFGLAAQMFYYGMAKIIPTQFPAPSLVTLVEPMGHLSLTDLLWTSIGASLWYQIFTGCAEMLGGVLLCAPRTTMFAALICLADMIQVFMLNMTYDFGLKQISFHYILLSAFLLAPDVPRLIDVFFRGRAAGPSIEPPLFRTPRTNRVALAAQIVFGMYLIGMFTQLSLSYWKGAGGGGSPRSPLYGIWNVDQLSVDGERREPQLNDYDRRWRRVIFDAANTMAFQRTDDSFAHYGVSVDANTGVVVLVRGQTWNARFTFERPAPDRLVLDGEMDSHRIHAQLKLVGLDTVRLPNSRFQWVRPPDAGGS